MAEQEDQPDKNSLDPTVFRPTPSLEFLFFGSNGSKRLPVVEVRCPRCNRPMHWRGRLKIFICDTDGFILGRNDPYVKQLEYEISTDPQASSGH
jgi:hypothetical protein